MTATAGVYSTGGRPGRLELSCRDDATGRDDTIRGDVRPNVLLTRRIPSSVLARLEAGADVDLYDGRSAIAREELLERVAGKQGLICLLTDRVDDEVLDAAGPELRVVANIAVGYNNLDLAACRARGIIATNTPDVLTNACADFTWTLILAITRRLGEAERQLRRGEWKGWALDHMLGMELRGKRLGLVGLGRIGRAVAEKATTFGMSVAYTARTVSDLAGAELLPLDPLLATSDVVSLHCPLTPETRHLIDKKALAKMKRSAFLINTSRGPVIDEAALAWALNHRLIAGAALDVYEAEPVVHPDLLSLENVMLIPHIASATTETRTAMADLAVRNTLAVLAGEPPLNPL
jgi:glyoxylate reductase